MWEHEDIKWRATALFLGLFTFLLCGMARADTFGVQGYAGTGVTADVAVSYQATSATEATVTLMVTNTTGAPPTYGAVTGLALNLPSNVSGLSDFSFSATDKGAKKFSAVMMPDGVGAGSFGDFDLGITNGKIKMPKNKKNKKNKSGQASASASASNAININGGKVKSGIDPGYEGTFVVNLTGTNLDLLTVANFLQEVSAGGGNGPANLVVRMQGVGPGGGESDFLTGQSGSAASQVPEPGTLLLLGVGAVGLARRFRRS
jgi:hypothetical protein